jgi:hypothetical protein
MKRLPLLLILPWICSSLFAQVAAPSQPQPGRTTSAGVSAPASMAHVGPEVNAMLSQLETAAQRTSMDVGKLSIRKWKTESAYKDQAEHDVNSVQANVSSTLPGIIAEVRTAPDNTANLFKLYRNVDALLDVVRGLAESAGAFGPKSQFEDLRNDSRNLAAVRGSLASQIETIAAAKETEIRQMRAQLAQAASAPPPAPKKVIVDDDEVPKHPTKRKKTTKPPAQVAPNSSSTKQ